MLLALFALVLTILLVIGLHEAGHAVAAKLCGVGIVRIAIGFGKPLFSRTDQNGCEWVCGILPLGGYVQLLNTRIAPVEQADYPRCFDKKPFWIRLVVLVSGGFANLLVAWLALTVFFMLGFERDIPVIGAIVPDSIAAHAGFREHDRIVAIADQVTPSWQDVGMRLIANLGQKDVAVRLASPDETIHQIRLDLQHIPVLRGNTLFPSLGFLLSPHYLQRETIAGRPLLEASREAILTSWQLLGFFLVMLKQLLVGAISFSMLLGPVSLLSVSMGSFLQGVAVFLYFIASLSLAVGVVNLLPVPTLDGGSILYALTEKIRGKPVSIAFEVLLHRLVVIGLFMLLGQLLLNDVQRYLAVS